MKIDEVVDVLNRIKNTHGDVDVAAWHYGGGLDDLMDVNPIYNEKLNVVLLEPDSNHVSKARR